eukprot:COSAG01_NODE_4617_length_4876_cov_14.078082_3_plen_74_part_00
MSHLFLSRNIEGGNAWTDPLKRWSASRAPGVAPYAAVGSVLCVRVPPAHSHPAIHSACAGAAAVASFLAARPD